MMVVFLVLGALAGEFKVLAPVHEIGHALAATFTGLQVDYIRWASMSIVGGQSNPITTMAGYIMEVGAFAAFTLHSVKMRRIRSAWFFLGLATHSFVESFFSSDFITLYSELGRVGWGNAVFFWSIIAGCTLLGVWHRTVRLLWTRSWLSATVKPWSRLTPSTMRPVASVSLRQRSVSASAANTSTH